MSVFDFKLEGLTRENLIRRRSQSRQSKLSIEEHRSAAYFRHERQPETGVSISTHLHLGLRFLARRLKCSDAKENQRSLDSRGHDSGLQHGLY